MKYLVVAIISLVVAFFAANLLYNGEGRVILGMATILFAILSAAVTPKER